MVDILYGYYSNSQLVGTVWRLVHAVSVAQVSQQVGQVYIRVWSGSYADTGTTYTSK